MCLNNTDVYRCVCVCVCVYRYYKYAGTHTYSKQCTSQLCYSFVDVFMWFSFPSTFGMIKSTWPKLLDSWIVWSHQSTHLGWDKTNIKMTSSLWLGIHQPGQLGDPPHQEPSPVIRVTVDNSPTLCVVGLPSNCQFGILLCIVLL